MEPGVVIVISSQVVRGCVGNRAMVFALERLGFAVWAAPTVLLPHHPGLGPAEKIAVSDSHFAALLDALIQSGIQAGRGRKVAAIVSGYLASPGQAESVAALVAAVKAEQPDTLYICDPVIGDAGGLYVDAAIANAVRDALLPLADAATPNAFECAWLARHESAGEPDLAACARQLPPETVLVTSTPALMRGKIGNLLIDGGETILFEHPLVQTPIKGTGDALTALLTARRLQGRAWPEATAMALASVYELIAASAKTGADELMLPQFQDSMIAPHASVMARRLGLLSGR